MTETGDRSKGEGASSLLPPHTQVHLHLSPQGYRCGLYAFQQGERSLLLLVLPKLWKDTAKPPKDRITLDGNTLQIIGYETEHLPIRFTGENNKAWKDLLDKAIDRLQGEEPADKSNGNNAPEDDAAEQLGSILDDKDLARSLRCLLAHSRKRKPEKWIEKANAPEQSEQSEQSEQTDPLTTWLDRLLRLVLFSRRFREHRKDYSPTDSGTGYLVDEGAHQSDPLRFLTTNAFIEEVKLRRREVRQGYRVETARLGVIRGRITARGMARHALAGEPRIECAYDEFTSQIPLFQVIVSALDHVAGGGPFPAAYRELPLVQEIRQSARRLRRDLAHIPSLPPAKAAYLAGRVRLKRLQRGWKPALHMAKLLLQRLPLDFTAETEGQGALVWNVDTSKVWEGTLQQMLERGSGWKVKPKVPAPPPWKGLKTKEPDLLATDGSVFYILDAKYKHRSEPKPTPSAAEQYQLFAYSHLSSYSKLSGESDEPKHTRCGLLYASTASGEKFANPQRPKPWPRNPGPAQTVDLIALAVPFPDHSKLVDDTTWTAWLDEIGPSLRKHLKSNTST